MVCNCGGTHRWATSSIQARSPRGAGGARRSWWALRSRLALLRDLELQPAMLEQASAHQPCQHNNLTLHCTYWKSGVAQRSVRRGARQAVIMVSFHQVPLFGERGTVNRITLTTFLGSVYWAK